MWTIYIFIVVILFTKYIPHLRDMENLLCLPFFCVTAGLHVSQGSTVALSSPESNSAAVGAPVATFDVSWWDPNGLNWMKLMMNYIYIYLYLYIYINHPKNQQLHPWKKAKIPQKGSFVFQLGHFQVRTVSFGEGPPNKKLIVGFPTMHGDPLSQSTRCI